MKFSLHAIGRMKSGAEKELFQKYWQRAQASGRGLGVSLLELREYGESKAGRASERKRQEASDLLKTIDKRAFVIALDERGKTMTSPDFANLLGKVRDQGAPEIIVIIGGADGLDESVHGRADTTIAFGAMTWPHQLVRILAAEQIYRAFSILSGHPYHKI